MFGGMGGRGLLAATLLAGALAAQGARAEEMPGWREFQDWVVTCDEAGDCTAFTFAGDAPDSFAAYLRLQRGAGREAAPRISLSVPQDDAGTSQPGPLRLEDGTRLAARFTGNDAGSTAVLAPAEAARLLGALRDDHALLIGDRYRLSLDGAEAALRWIDAQQGRAGAPSALAARGKGPEGALPSPPRLTVPSGAATALSGAAPRAVLARRGAIDDCDDTGSDPAFPAEGWRLPGGPQLWALHCFNSAYNEGTAYILYDPARRTAREAPFQLPEALKRQDNPASSILLNAEFDPATLTLSSIAKGRGLGDCGDQSDYVWTGEAFALSARRDMPWCRGVPPEDWASLRATRR